MSSNGYNAWQGVFLETKIFQMTLFWNWKEASDQIGDFWNLLAIFFTKVAQMFGGFLGSCENHCFLSQTG